MKKLFFIAATVCVILSSCSKSEEPIIEVSTKTPINLSISQATRANDTTFESGDNVGLDVVNYNGATAGTLATSGNYVDNMKFTYDGSAWTPTSTIYWLDKTTKADLYAYYPYSTPTDVSAHQFSVQTDQSNETNYWASDFLWGKAEGIPPTKNAVPITTNHAFSNILIYLVAGEGFTAETFAAATKSVKINNIKTSATINLATGEATATGNTATVIPWKESDHYRAMVVPQTVTNSVALITVTINDVEYSLKKAITFAPNTQHKATIRINRTSNGVNIGIGGWESDNNDYGGDAE